MRKFPISARHVACMYIGSADSSKFPLLILTPNCLLTYFVTHRQYFHLIVNKMYVFCKILQLRNPYPIPIPKNMVVPVKK